MAVMEYTKPRHPIGYVAASTGLSTHVIRIWERRYGAIEPQRSGTNRRLYTDEDIDRLKMLRALTESGHAIGGIAKLTEDELREILGGLSTPAPTPIGIRARGTVSKEGPVTALKLCQDAVVSMNVEQLNTVLLDAMVHMPQLELLEDLVTPLLTWTGDRWHDGSLRIAQEHLATATIKSFLIRMQQSAHNIENGPVLAVSTPPGELHELGAIMASICASSQGWKPLYFGPSLPSAELINAVSKSKARAVALSVTIPREMSTWMAEVRELRQLLPAHVPILIGGHPVAGYRAQLDSPGIQCCDSLRGFQESLQRLYL